MIDWIFEPTAPGKATMGLPHRVDERGAGSRFADTGLARDLQEQRPDSRLRHQARPDTELAGILRYHPDYCFEAATLETWAALKHRVISPTARQNLLRDAQMHDDDELIALRRVHGGLDAPGVRHGLR